MHCLVIESGKRKGQQLILPAGKEVVVGRDEDCKIRLNAHGVSRRHCVLQRTDEGIRVRDLGSRNGTLVNEKPIEDETLLKPGDRLQVGPLVFRAAERVEEEAMAGPEATAGPEGTAETPPAGATTEEEIADWLAEGKSEGQEGAGEGGETAVLAKGRDDDNAASHPAREKKFESIADEAADIIRRWREMTGEEPTSEESRESGP